MHATHTTPLQSTREKYILTHNSLFTAHYSILNAHCQVLIAQCSLITAPLLIAHNSHTKHNYSLLTTHTQRTTHNSLFTTHFLPRTTTTFFASRPFTSSTNKSMNMIPDELQVFPVPVACVSFLHWSASPYSYNSRPINVWKKTYTSQLIGLLPIHYSIFIILNSRHTPLHITFLFIAQSYLRTVLARNSQLTTYCSLFIAHHWQLSIDHYPLLTTHH